MDEQEFELEAELGELYELEATVDQAEVAEEVDKVADMHTEGEVKAIMRQPSHFTIGDPVILRLSVPQSAEGVNRPAEQTDTEQYEYCLVKLACSFRPAAKTRFTEATFEVELKTDPAGKAAIVYDMFPQRVEDEEKAGGKFTIGPEFKIKLGPVEGSITPIKLETSREYIQYTSRILGSGLQEPKVVWDFVHTKSRKIEGSQGMVMVVRKPVGTTVTAKISLGAKVEPVESLGPIGPFTLTTFKRGNQTISEGSDIPIF